MPRMKKMPDLKKLMVRDGVVRAPQTSDQQFAIFAAMAEASKVLRKN